MKQQVVVIHGGGSFISRSHESIVDIIAKKQPDLDSMRRSVDWKATLQDTLGDTYDVLAPRMPNADAPRYAEWKLWFEKILLLIDARAVFVGHSLGAMFLVKYFSESPKNAEIPAVFLVAPPCDALGYDWELTSVSRLTENVRHVFFYHSKDDSVVDFKEMKKFQEKLPHATYRALDGRGHFNKDDFPEIIDDIKNI